MKRGFVEVFLIANILCTNFAQTPPTRLHKILFDTNAISLSGFSSGGTFAQQLQFSYSSLFSGIAVFAHAYYRCGPGDGIAANYDNACTKIGSLSSTTDYDPNNALKDIQDYASRGLIENPTNLRNKKLYVYAGTQNFVFATDQSLRILNVYEPFIQNTCSIRTRVQASNLALPTDHFGGMCGNFTANQFFLSNCGFSGPFEALNFLHGESVRYPPFAKGQRVSLQPLEQFDQTEFFYRVEGRHDMDSIGYIYIPRNCVNNARCMLHFYFHGCRSGRQFLEDNHIQNSGFLEIAELNNIIMVFPQALNSTENRSGCWDTFGVTGELYATQRGAQVTVVRNIISRLLGEDSRGRRAPNYYY